MKTTAALLIFSFACIPLLSFADTSNQVVPVNNGDVLYLFPQGGITSIPSFVPTSTDSKGAPVAPSFDAAPPVDITWHTNTPGTSRVYYATSTTSIDLSSPYISVISNDILSRSHTIRLFGLAMNTPYSVVYQSRDSKGKLIVSEHMQLDIRAVDSSSGAATSTATASSTGSASSSIYETESGAGTTTFFENIQVSP